VTSLGRSQSGGQGKHTGRSMKRTMQRRNPIPAGYCWQRRGIRGGDSVFRGGSLASLIEHNGRDQRTTGVGSMARVERAVAKVGKVSWVALALPHSEGATYKRQCREIVACPRDWRMGS
jgi:hypothetical protein